MQTSLTKAPEYCKQNNGKQVSYNNKYKYQSKRGTQCDAFCHGRNNSWWTSRVLWVIGSCFCSHHILAFTERLKRGLNFAVNNPPLVPGKILNRSSIIRNIWEWEAGDISWPNLQFFDRFKTNHRGLICHMICLSWLKEAGRVFSWTRTRTPQLRHTRQLNASKLAHRKLNLAQNRANQK